MNEIVTIIRRSRKNSRVLLDNGRKILIPSVYAVVGNFVDPNLRSTNFPIPSESIPRTESTKQRAETVFFGDCDYSFIETDKSIFAKKCDEKVKEGFVIIQIDTSYRLQQDPPNVFYFAKFVKKDNLP